MFFCFEANSNLAYFMQDDNDHTMEIIQDTLHII